MRRVPRRLVFLLLLVLSPSTGRSQLPPSPADVLGYGLGERFTDAASVVRYAETLGQASDRVILRRYGMTAEGRPLLLLVVSSSANLARLEEVQRSNARLTRPDLGSTEASEIVRANPAIAWFTYGVHGDEAASTEAALWTAWDLATADGEGRVVLDSLIVVIDPMANPDGRDRYVQWYRDTRGMAPNPRPDSREHHPPWPGGRYNHYLFDLNRDWTWATQGETRDRLKAWQLWNPQVHVDFHEMGYSSSYFFFPSDEPVNPIYPDYTARWAEYFGRANAAEFDRRRWLYYTAETFDLFYPGFGDTWPSLVGAVGMTYEQAGSGEAGLAVERTDGTVLTLEERATHHRVAGLTTLRAAAARKTDLLREFAGFHRSQADAVADFLLVPGPDPRPAERLVLALQKQGVRVERATEGFRPEATPHPGFEARAEFPVGTYRVRSSQARGRLAVTLLQPETSLGEGVQRTYDITAWSLPYAFGVEAHTVDASIAGSFTEVPAYQADSDSVRLEPVYGWLVRPDFGAAGPLSRYVAAGGRAFVLEAGFEQGGEDWPAGTVFLPGDDGAADGMTSAGLAPLATAVRSGVTNRGRDLGTGSSLVMRDVRIALLSGEGFYPTSFGSAWYLLEVLAGIRFDALDAGTLGTGDLDPYDAVLVPVGSPRRAGGRVEETLTDWVSRGGTLIAFGAAARWAASELELELRTGPAPESEEDRRRLGLRTIAERRSDAWDEEITGIILPLRLDEDHPLAWGATSANQSGRAFALHLSDLRFEPSEELETVASFGPLVSVISGAVSADKLEEIASSAWLSVARHGRGKVILFADDPLFRLMWPANFVLVTNALLYGPLFR